MNNKIILKLFLLVVSINVFTYSSSVVRCNYNSNSYLSGSGSNYNSSNKTSKKSRVSQLISLILNKYGDKIGDWFLKKIIIAGLSTIVGPVVADIIVESAITEWNNRKGSKNFSE